MNKQKQEAIAAMQLVMDRLDPHNSATSQCCPTCGIHPPKHLHWGFYDCANCGINCHSSDMPNKPLEDFLPLTKVGIARGITYYHWTRKPSWRDNLPSHIMAHLGSKQAAFDRMWDEMHSAKTRMHKDDRPDEGLVYSVTLVPGVPFERNLRCDEEDMLSKRPSFSENVCGKDSNRDCVERYLNVVEAPGSISLCATKDMFTVVKVETAREFFGDEAVEITHGVKSRC